MSQRDPKGFYHLLGVAYDASASDIKSAYRRLAMELHPDRNKDPSATQQFQRLNEAFETLSNPIERAEYDTSGIDSRPQVNNRQPKRVEPVACSRCAKISAQPRYVIFFRVISLIFFTTREPVQGIYCSSCAEKVALGASATTWILGWWGFPWGPIYSLHAIAANLSGGNQPNDVNARLAFQQAWSFLTSGNLKLAQAVAHDALRLAMKVKVDRVVSSSNDSANSTPNEAGSLSHEIRRFIDSIEQDDGGPRLQDAWSTFRRPFYLQLAPLIMVAGFIVYLVLGSRPQPAATEPNIPYAPPVDVRAQPVAPAYVRPHLAPNGESWPVVAGYVRGYPKKRKGGESTVVVDNRQNTSDVFVRLFALDGDQPERARQFYIPAHSQFEVEDIAPGRYDVRYRDLETGGISRSEAFDLTERKVDGGIEYSTMSMTLYKVPHGNMQTYEIEESEF